jgi:hypothetical protein
MELQPHQLQAFLAIGLGFAVAGMVSAAVQYLTDRPASFHVLGRGDWRALAAMPVLFTAGPAIIMRNTIRGRRFERRSATMVALATIIACLWSLLCGKLAMALAAPLLAGLAS